MWSACHKKSYLTNLEVWNPKSEISCLCPVWLSQFCLFWKKMGKGFVNIPKFVNSTHNKYRCLWHDDHISVKNHVAEKTEILVCQIKVGDLKKVFSLMFVRFLHWRFFNIIYEILKNVKRKIIVIYLHSTFSVFSLRIFYVGPKNS